MLCSVLKSCLTLCDPMDYSPPGSSVHGVFQARVLKRIAISFSRGSRHPGVEPMSPVSPTVAGGLFTTKPPGLSLSSVQFTCSVLSGSLQPHGLQHARLPCPSPTPGVAQTHGLLAGDAIQPSHPLSSPSLPTFNLSQCQGLFK